MTPTVDQFTSSKVSFSFGKCLRGSLEFNNLNLYCYLSMSLYVTVYPKTGVLNYFKVIFHVYNSKRDNFYQLCDIPFQVYGLVTRHVATPRTIWDVSATIIFFKFQFYRSTKNRLIFKAKNNYPEIFRIHKNCSSDILKVFP